MKKHLVLIVGNYYPNPSPTGKCAEAYVDLLREEYEISVICYADVSCESYCHEFKLVYPTADRYSLFLHRLEHKNAPRLVQNIFKVPVHLFHRFVHPNLLYSYAAKAQRQLEAIHAERPVDVVFSVGAPMAAHAAAYNFHRIHPEIRWVTYTVDSYAVQNKSLRRAAQALEYEAKVLGASHKVLLSEEVYNSVPMLYRDFADKCGVLPYLMPPTLPHAENAHYFNPEKTNLVYAGRFYKAIRNPEYLLQLALEMDDSFVMHLYCQSDCDSLIDEYVHRAGGKIVRHAPVSVEEIQRIYAQADALINVGNNTPEFKPSKTFEYIASGKPILSINYEGQFDTTLSQSPLALQLGRDMPVKEGVVWLYDFLQNNRGKTLTRTEIDTIYCKHSSKNIKSILCAAMEE